MQHQGGGQLSSQQRHSWLASVFLFLLCSHMWWLKERKKRENKREKEKTLIPSWGTTLKTPCQPGYLPKALLPNIIILGVKGGHNSLHSSYAYHSSYPFLNQEPAFISFSLLLLINFSWSILGTRWTFLKIHILSICGRMIGYEKTALLFPRKWIFYIQSLRKFPWFSKSRYLSQFIERM